MSSSAYKQKRKALADSKNAELKTEKTQLQNILKDSLSRDDYIELDRLKTSPRVTPFTKSAPQRDSFLPSPLSGLNKIPPWKRSAYEELVYEGVKKYQRARSEYTDAKRFHDMRTARKGEQALEHNRHVEELKEKFAVGESKTIEGYFVRVLHAGSYPESFSRKSILGYRLESRLLLIDHDLPLFQAMPTVKSFRYVEVRDRINETALSQTERKQLYRSVIAQIPLRTIHTIFTADRTEKIDHVIFYGYANDTDPGTGKSGRFCLVSVSTTREQFGDLNLELAEPLLCLQLLNAHISHKPEDLVTVSPIEIISDTTTPPTISLAAIAEHSPRRADEIYQAMDIVDSEEAPKGIRIPARPASPKAEAAGVGIQESTLSNARMIDHLQNQIKILEATIEEQEMKIADLETALQEQKDELKEQIREEKAAITAEFETTLEDYKDIVDDLENALESEIEEKQSLIAKLSNATQQRETSSSDHLSVLEEQETHELAGKPDTPGFDSLTPREETVWGERAGGELVQPIDKQQPSDNSANTSDPSRGLDAELYATMTAIVTAEEEYVDYVAARLSTADIVRLLSEGKLEPHKFLANRMRPSAAGEAWYREFSSLQEPPNRDFVEVVKRKSDLENDSLDLILDVADDGPHIPDELSDLEATIEEQEMKIADLETALQEQKDELKEQIREEKAAIIAEFETTLEDYKDIVDDLENALESEIEEKQSLIAKLSNATQQRETSSSDHLSVLEEQETHELAGKPDTPGFDSLTPREETVWGERAGGELVQPIDKQQPSDNSANTSDPSRGLDAELYATMIAIVTAEEEYVDYVAARLSTADIVRLLSEGKLEPHKFLANRMRPSAAGEAWYREFSSLQEPPNRDFVEVVKRKSDLENDSLDLILDVADDGPHIPDELSDMEVLENILHGNQNDNAKLLTVIMNHNWECSETAIQLAFPRTQFVSTLIDDLNERAYDEIGENLIIGGEELWVVDREFRVAVEHCLRRRRLEQS